MSFSDRNSGAVTHAVLINGAQCTISGAIDSTGKFFPLDSCQITEHENADGTLSYIEATDGVSTWRQTYSYSTTNPKRTTSQWVKQ